MPRKTWWQECPKEGFPLSVVSIWPNVSYWAQNTCTMQTLTLKTTKVELVYSLNYRNRWQREGAHLRVWCQRSALSVHGSKQQPHHYWPCCGTLHLLLGTHSCWSARNVLYHISFPFRVCALLPVFVQNTAPDHPLVHTRHTQQLPATKSAHYNRDQTHTATSDWLQQTNVTLCL